MSKRTKKTARYSIRTLEFQSATRLVNFLLSAVDEPEFAPGSGFYEKFLNRIFVKPPKTLLIRVQGHADVIERLESMVRAGVAQATIHSGDRLPADAAPMSIEKLMRRIQLHKLPETRYRGGHLLTALWNADQETLSQYVSYLWDLGATGMEIAFVRPRSKADMPSHLVRIHGLRHPDAFQSWGERDGVTAELYLPMTGAHHTSHYYVEWGWRFPVHGLDRLVALDCDLVLLRRTPDHDATEWRVFKTGEVHFFQKPHELLELTIARHDQPLIEMDPDSRERNVPLEVAIVPRSRSALREYWQVDREIDRLRRSLRDLELNRARLVGRERDEVFFAYRFDQSGSTELNALMLRLLQQRMGTLTGYDYAFCRPEHGDPFHLVIANRPSRALGYSLQVADRVYYQLRQWRNWGVNLYLPLDSELAPLIDSGDAIPLLQRVLERTAKHADGEIEEGEGDYREWDAILWEPSGNGNIVETRVKDKQPLLSRFRLLNSFQCRVARDVEQRTRQKLAESVQNARRTVADELDQLETELLEAVEKRAAQVEQQFAGMQQRLEKAEGLVTQLKPQVQTVTDQLLQKPENWVEFVRTVVRTHAELVKLPLDAFEDLKGALRKIDVALLKTLVPRTKNLVEAAQRECGRLDGQFKDFDQQREEAASGIKELESLSVRINAVLAEVATTFRQIQHRVHRVEELEKDIAQKEKEIDEIDGREKEVESRHEHVKRLREEADERSAETDRKLKEICETEHTLTQQVAELGHLRLRLSERGGVVSARLGQLSRQIADAREQSDEMEQLSQELATQIGLVNAHTEAVATWEKHRQSWQTRIDVRWNEQSQRIESMSALVRSMRDRHDRLNDQEGIIDEFEGELGRLDRTLTDLRDNHAQLAGDT